MIEVFEGRDLELPNIATGIMSMHASACSFATNEATFLLLHRCLDMICSRLGGSVEIGSGDLSENGGRHKENRIRPYDPCLK